MSEALIKICGVTSAEAIAAAAENGASHVGFVYFEDSPRYVAPRDSMKLAKAVPDGVKRVGVFVDPDDALLERAVMGGRLDVIQLHGSEKPERVKELKARHQVRIWKAVPVSAASDLENAKRYVGIADRLIYDARTPKASRLPGGMGIAFDWSLLDRYKHKAEWGLSGGLSAENIGEAIRTTGAPLVDVSSGVESEPGVKDPDKIAAFCAAVKHAA